MATPQLVVDLITQSAPTPAPMFVLTDEQRAETLLAELNAVRTRMAARKALETPAVEPTTQPTSPKSDSHATSGPAAVPLPSNRLPSIVADPSDPKIAPPSVPLPPHPFAAARDAAYAPPADRNVGAAPKLNNRPPPPPVAKEGDARRVFNTALDAQFVITNRDLLSVAPEIRTLYRDAVTPRRGPIKEATQLYGASIDPDPLSTFAVEPLNELRSTTEREANIWDSLPTAVHTAAQAATPTVPTDGYIVPDPLSVLYAQGAITEGLVASADSKSIRSILPIVDNQQAVESIIDPGSQICAMSEAICHELALPYDPTVILQMQSANGAITPSLGLARNVPFKIGDMTLYLQVHIVRNPAYDILLGRPFDVLTQSVVRNYGNDDQTLTIRDPNTGKTATVPTIPRGSARGKSADFLLAKTSSSTR
uniref:Aspartic peptidase DDI1-type domain-containing protein n=1 Tax=Mycena chlorophos TaxID=658473 RepID=A0ABQ0L403_MYCCL|nr:predicted protein [Mycena chlorophos]